MLASLPAALRHAPPPANLGTFFSIYFLMTGLHGLHVVIGMGLYLWLLRRAGRGDFGPGYYVPVDGVALYWHLVDLIWIFLFPLFYLM
jgi:cytochrome c oxidase subunit 3